MVDARPVCAYLAAAMLRRLLACLALLTGLAAIGAPVNAGVVDTFAAQVGASKAAPAVPSTERADCQAQRTSTGNRREQPECRQRRPVIIYIPTVQYGPDRALE